MTPIDKELKQLREDATKVDKNSPEYIQNIMRQTEIFLKLIEKAKE